ncbi:hypothetical protein CDG79_29120 [Nostoc sp. 'Peltigera membranacea cyanobiont' 232]|nr:hypothetical protein CDG79_29120 [Nostoc sp. 'Peltigera membranacea cyanobiont' 232]
MSQELKFRRDVSKGNNLTAITRISHKLQAFDRAEGQRGRGERTWYLNSPLLPCTSTGFERCGEKSGYKYLGNDQPFEGIRLS